MPKTSPSRCFTSRSLSQLYSILKPGYLLEFQRTGYAHWAVYVGVREYEGEKTHCVIHRSIPPEADKTTLFLASRSAQQIKAAGVKITKVCGSETNRIGDILLQDIESVLGKDRVRINNGKDNRWIPKEPEEIVGRADEALHSIYTTPYHLLTNNCEHFANSCRYGRRVSSQVPDVMLKAASTVGGVVVPIAARSTAVALLLPAIGVAATGPIGLAITGTSIAVAIASAAIPPAVHAYQCKKKK